MNSNQKNAIREAKRQLIASAKRYNIAIEDTPLSGFAAACYETNTITELLESIDMRAADKMDCESWDIMPTQWRVEIRRALSVMIYETIEIYNDILNN